MDSERLKHLAGLREAFDRHVWTRSMSVIENAMVDLQDEAYSLPPEQRESTLAAIDAASYALNPIRHLRG